jgi:nitroreductase
LEEEFFVNATLTLLKERTSANNFDKRATLTEREIAELVEYAVEAPSSYNIQHWRFVAVNDKATQEKLKAVSYNQQKVADAAVTFVIFGDLKGVEKLPAAIEPLLKAGAIDKAAYDGWIGSANGMYKDNPQAQRDEAIRSGALAAMNLMIAAQAKGLVSAPMIGFDPQAVKNLLGVPEHFVPVIMIAVGPAAPGNWPRKPRFSTEQVLSFNKYSGLKL